MVRRPFESVKAVRSALPCVKYNDGKLRKGILNLLSVFLVVE